MRRSRGCCEKFHGAIIDHCGHENTRVFRETAALGAELKKLGDSFLDSRLESKAAVIFDWDNWWAATLSAGPTADMNYPEEVFRFYNAFARRNVSVDIIGTDTPLDTYKILCAPILYMVKPGFADKLKTFVEHGGVLGATYFSGMADEYDLVTQDGYPGELRSLCGLWVEETDALQAGQSNRLVCSEGHWANSPLAGTWKVDLLCDIIHTEGAQTIARYADDFYAETSALCRNSYGKGTVWYFGSRPEAAFMDRFAALVCGEYGITPEFPPQEGVEATRRIKGEKEFVFVLNHNKVETKLVIPFACRDLLTDNNFASGACYSLPSAGVLILEKAR
jgi:beta-galactosidase